MLNPKIVKKVADTHPSVAKRIHSDFFMFMFGVIIVLLSLFFFIRIGSGNHMYIDAHLENGQVVSFKNVKNTKAVITDGGIYSVGSETLPIHIEDGSSITIAVSEDGHVLGNQRYLVDGQFYYNGQEVNISKNGMRAVSWDRYCNMITDESKIIGIRFISLITAAVGLFFIFINYGEIKGISKMNGYREIAEAESNKKKNAQKTAESVNTPSDNDTYY